MRLFRRNPAQDAGPPLGVILHYRGRAIGCDVVRVPELDRRGQTAWAAVPAERVTIRPGDLLPELTATVLPDGCLLTGPPEWDRE